MSKFSENLKARKFIITSEVGPPKGTNIEPTLEEANHFRDKVTAINVTDLQSAVMKIGSLATCIKLRERGFEPVMQLVCRDRNRLALQSELLNAAIFGIENILCLTGDHQSLGDHEQSKGVFDLDSVQLLAAAKRLMQGTDMSGEKLDGNPNFFLGAVVTPQLEPVELQVMKMEKKIKAGAQFFQTQGVFEPDKFAQFMKKVKQFNVPVLAGIIILKSAGMAKFMNENVAGVVVPEPVIQEMADTKKDDRKKKAVEISVRIIQKVKPLCQGVHIMPLGWDELVPQIIEEASLA